MRFETDHVAATFDLSAGARLASLVVHGHELLITTHESVFGWGSFPMVPYAGRVAHGRFQIDGESHSLPVNFGPHAIHGTVCDQVWEQAGPGAMRCALGDRWPFGGSVTQRAELDDDSLTMTLVVNAGDRPMPSMAGWHPWFRRELVTGAPVVLHVDPGAMYELDDEAIPTGRLVEPPPGPWDNCFTGLSSPPVLTWPGVLSLTLTSSCTEWVVYDRPEYAICVEPQTDAPDSFNRRPLILQPGETLEATFTMAWSVST